MRVIVESRGKYDHGARNTTPYAIAITNDHFQMKDTK